MAVPTMGKAQEIGGQCTIAQSGKSYAADLCNRESISPNNKYTSVKQVRNENVRQRENRLFNWSWTSEHTKKKGAEGQNEINDSVSHSARKQKRKSIFRSASLGLNLRFFNRKKRGNGRSHRHDPEIQESPCNSVKDGNKQTTRPAPIQQNAPIKIARHPGTHDSRPTTFAFSSSPSVHITDSMHYSRFLGTVGSSERSFQKKDEQKPKNSASRSTSGGFLMSRLSIGSAKRVQSVSSIPPEPITMPPLTEISGPFQVSDFLVLNRIGHGNFGEVFLCRHLPTNENVVVKAIAKGTAYARRQHQHVTWEKWALATLKNTCCPHVARGYGTFQDMCNLYFVMEYVPGGELFARLDDVGTLSEKDARFYLAQVILSISHMHEQAHMLFRDIKPENILLDADGYVRLVDFGFSKPLKHRHEHTYTLCGTPDYIAPELLLQQGHGFEVDLWAIGVLLFEMLTGEAPFPEPGQVQSILSGQFSIPAHVSEPARGLIRSLLCLDPKRRLGAGHNGMQDLISHRWFQGFDWAALCQRKMKPPFQPIVRTVGDAAHFDSSKCALSIGDFRNRPKKEIDADTMDAADYYFMDFDAIFS